MKTNIERKRGKQDDDAMPKAPPIIPSVSHTRLIIVPFDTHAHTQTHAHIHSHSHTQVPTYTHPNTRTHPLTLTHTSAHTHTHKQSNMHSLSLSFSLLRKCYIALSVSRNTLLLVCLHLVLQ